MTDRERQYERLSKMADAEPLPEGVNIDRSPAGCWVMRDALAWGVAISIDGKRIPPEDFYK